MDIGIECQQPLTSQKMRQPDVTCLPVRQQIPSTVLPKEPDMKLIELLGPPAVLQELKGTEERG